MRRRAIAGLAVLALGAAACGKADDSSQPSAQADAATVEMELVALVPESLEIKSGTTVTWNQKDAGAHTVTSGTVEQGAVGVEMRPDGQFDSGDIPTDGTFERTFDEAGTFPYFCALHPATMRGEIRVT